MSYVLIPENKEYTEETEKSRIEFIKRVHIYDNPLYTDTRYIDIFLYNDNLTIMKPSLKGKQSVTKYIVFNILKKRMFWDIC